MTEVVMEVRTAVRTDVDTMVESTVLTGLTSLLMRLWQIAGSRGSRMMRSKSTAVDPLLHMN